MLEFGKYNEKLGQGKKSKESWGEGVSALNRVVDTASLTKW